MGDKAFSGWAASPCKLRRVLRRAEYNMLANAPIFEGDFVQVTRKGEYIGIHNRPHVITLGILATSPNLLLPNLMIIAQERQRAKAKTPKARDLEISRVIPLNTVEIFVQDVNERRLKVQMVTGRKYYLQLYAPGADENFLFERWMRLVYLLHVVRGRITSFTSKESGLHIIWKRPSLQTMNQKHWFPAIMDKGSTERMKKRLHQIYTSTDNQSSMESDLTSRLTLLGSEYAAYASQGSPGIIDNVKHASREQTYYTAPEVKKKRNPKQPVKSQAWHGSRKPKSKKQPLPKRAQSKYTTTVGVGPSKVVMIPLAVGPSTTPKRINTPGVSQTKSLFIPPISSDSGSISVKLERSQKFRSLVEALPTAPTKEECIALQRKSQERSPVFSNSYRSSSQGREQSAFLSPSVKQSRPKSTSASIRASPTSPAPRSRISMQASPTNPAPRSPISMQASPTSPAQRSPISMPASPTSPAPRSLIPAAVEPSNIHSVTVAFGPSEPGVASTAAGPSRPVSRGSDFISERQRSPVPPEQESRGRSSTLYSQTTNVKSQEISKSQSIKQKSLSPSPKRGSLLSPSRSRKEGKVVPVHRTMESVAVGPSQVGWKSVAVGPSLPGGLFASRPQTPKGAGKESDTKPKSQEKKAKSKDKSRPSSAAAKQELRKQQESETKSKLKAALNAVKQKSSVTFITIYSALSSSLDKIKKSKSKEDNKAVEDVSRKFSKRVTISGVIGPSGKGVLQEEEEAVNPEGNIVDVLVEDVSSKTAALKWTEAEGYKPPESHLPRSDVISEGKVAAVVGNISEAAELQKQNNRIMAEEPYVANPEEARKTDTVEWFSIMPQGSQGVSQEPLVTSRTPTKSRSPVSPSKPGSKTSPMKTSQKSLPKRESPRRAGGDSLPPRSKVSVATGRSAVQTVSVAIGPSSPSNRINSKQPSMQPQQQSRIGDGQKSISKPSAVFSPPLRSHVSVGMGRSVMQTKSMAVGRSVKKTKSVGVGRSMVDYVSRAAGPSRPDSKLGPRSRANISSKSQWFGFSEVEAKPVGRTMSSQKSRAASSSRPASSSRKPRDPSDRSGL